MPDSTASDGSSPLSDGDVLAVLPFTRQPEGDDFLVGRPETGRFVVIPPEAMQTLDWLAEGRSVGEVRRLYRDRFDEGVDLDHFATILRRYGLVEVGEEATKTEMEAQRPMRSHFKSLSPRVAGWFVSKPALALYASIIITAVIMVASRPSLIPTWRAFYFDTQMFQMVLMFIPLYLVGVALHELGHLAAARAQGLPARFGVGTRLWDLVAETDLSGIWSLPREKRYLPLAAGMLVDLVSMSLAFIALYAHSSGWITMPPLMKTIVAALTLRYALGIAWQFQFYLRTDVYYLFANYFRNSSLMSDTNEYLRHVWSPVIPFLARPSSDNAGQKPRMVKLYAGLWVLGRVIAISILATVHAPILYNYCKLMMGLILSGGGQEGLSHLLLAIAMLGSFLAGFSFWIYNLIFTRRSAR